MLVDDFIAPPCGDDIQILYQDSSLLFIDKPSGLLSLSGKNPKNKDSVHFRLVQDYPTATLVHRLDFGTSGIMVVALNKAVNGILTKQFQARTVEKRYIAMLEGVLDQQERIIDLPIAKDKALFPRLKICGISGKQAVTEFKVLETLHSLDCTRVAFTPQTGRTHQLRIHSHAIGNPILGCDLYCSSTSQKKSDRLMLHANELVIDHPETGKRLIGVSECPF